MADFDQKRMTAVKCRICDLATGKYCKQEGFNPNYVITALGEKVSRARILGTIVSVFRNEDGSYASVTIDDGTSTIRAKLFADLQLLDGIKPGDIADMIGKVKEYNDELYMSSEAITVVGPNFEMMRRLELISSRMSQRKKFELFQNAKDNISDISELTLLMREKYGVSEEETKSFMEAMGEASPAEGKKGDLKEEVMKAIEASEDGVSLESLFDMFPSGVETALNDLINEGMIYEPVPGKLKKV